MVPQCPLAPSGSLRVLLVSINIVFAPLSRFLIPALALGGEAISVRGQLLGTANGKEVSRNHETRFWWLWK